MLAAGMSQPRVTFGSLRTLGLAHILARTLGLDHGYGISRYSIHRPLHPILRTVLGRGWADLPDRGAAGAFGDSAKPPGHRRPAEIDVPPGCQADSGSRRCDG